jgi:hypothetical protein
VRPRGHPLDSAGGDKDGPRGEGAAGDRHADAQPDDEPGVIGDKGAEQLAVEAEVDEQSDRGGGAELAGTEHFQRKHRTDRSVLNDDECGPRGYAQAEPRDDQRRRPADRPSLDQRDGDPGQARARGHLASRIGAMRAAGDGGDGPGGQQQA